MPRVKPPRTVEHGLFDSPTVLNNAEDMPTYLHTLGGSRPGSGIGVEKPGNQAFAITGDIENTGLIEVLMGTTCAKSSTT